MDFSERPLRAISSVLLSSYLLLFISASARACASLIRLVYAMLRCHASRFWRAFDSHRAEILVHRRVAFPLEIVNASQVYVRPGNNCRIRCIFGFRCRCRSRRWRNQLREKLLRSIRVSCHHRCNCQTVLRFWQAGVIRQNALESCRGSFGVLQGNLAVALRELTIEL